MKKLLVLAALMMTAAPAMASKARLNALGRSVQLTDVQTIFTRPDNLVSLGNWATFELGAAGSTATTATAYSALTTPLAEGGFSRSMGDSYFGFYMGHHNDLVTYGRNVGFGAGLTEENPIDLYYATKMGDMSYGAGLWYASSNKNSTSAKQSSMGVRASIDMANADAFVSYGITDSNENATTKYTGSSPVTLGGSYTLDSWYFFADMTSQNTKSTTGGIDTNGAKSSYRLGAVNTMKADGSNFFYGLSYEAFNQGKDIPGIATTNLPFIMGLEQEANSWLTVRGSVKQTVLLSSNTTGTTVVNTDTLDNNTTVAAGVGIKFNKLILDASIAKTAGAQTGDINGNNLLSNAALTYMF